MAWETRSGYRYYYRKRRIGRRVVSEYVGAGELAELQSELDAGARNEQKREREARDRQLAEVQALDAELDQVRDLTNGLTRAMLLLAGYHPHKGQWRLRRNGKY